jgi:hypothetical protein
MSNYFSRLATRSGLLNPAQGTTLGVAHGFQKGHQISQQHVEIQTEYSTVKTLESVKSDIGSTRHTPTHVKATKPVPSSSHHEGKIELPVSGITPDHSSQPNSQNPIEKKQTLSSEQTKAVATERVERGSVEHPSPVAESKQADMGSQSVASVPDSPLRVAQIDAIQADHSNNVDEHRVLLQNDVVRPIVMTSDNILSPQNERSNVDMIKTSQVEQPGSDPLLRVPEFKSASKTSRNDSKPSGQHEQAIAEQPFRQQSGQLSQINIQSITLEVHQAEPARAPAPAPAPRHHAPAPKQNPPSQTRLSRYYLKGW